jgi:hypothetical protein
MKNFRDKLSKAKKLILESNNSITLRELKEKFSLTQYETQQIAFVLNHIDDIISTKEDASASALIKVSKLIEELSVEKKKVKKLQKEGVSLQKTIDHLSESKLFSLDDLQTISPINLEIDSNEKGGIAIASYTDQHIEKIIEPYEVNNWNKHNPDIAVERFMKFTYEVSDEIRKTNILYEKKSRNKIKTLILAFLGDGIQGYLREEDLKSNDMSPTQASRLYKSLLIDSIRKISEDSGIDDIRVVLIWGNHPRTTKKIEFSTGWANSYEYLAYQDVESAFRNLLHGYNNLKFYIPKSGVQEMELYPGFPITFSHGFNFRYMGGIGGVEIPMLRWHFTNQESLPAKRRYIGHWHQYKTGTVSICGCGIGFDAYAMSKNFAPELPSGFFEMIEIGKGFSFNKKIIVDDFYKNKVK